MHMLRLHNYGLSISHQALVNFLIRILIIVRGRFCTARLHPQPVGGQTSTQITNGQM